MGLTDCVVNDCGKPAAAPAVFCVGHLAGVGDKPGRIEPAAEEAARRAGEAALRQAKAEMVAPVLDQGEAYAPMTMFVTNGGSGAVPPTMYLQACLHGSEGQMRQMVAKALLPALEQALRGL